MSIIVLIVRVIVAETEFIKSTSNQIDKVPLSKSNKFLVLCHLYHFALMSLERPPNSL